MDVVQRISQFRKMEKSHNNNILYYFFIMHWLKKIKRILSCVYVLSMKYVSSTKKADLFTIIFNIT